MNAKTVKTDVRPSPIAGTWYPGSPRELQKTVDDYLAHAEPVKTDDELIALVSPHAGYPYSGQTAAHAYRQLQDRQYDTVVLMGPSHREDFGAYAISAKKFYWTPLGEIELDTEFIDALARELPITRVQRDQEHSLEIQLPFLQRMLGTFKLVPIMMSLPFYIVGENALKPCKQLATTLAKLAQNKRVLFVASSDLSHLEDYFAVKKFDQRFADLLGAFDIAELARYMRQGRECRACGDAPIITELLAAQTLGANRVRLLHQTNSGDVTGERERADYVVGYLAAGIYRSAHEQGKITLGRRTDDE